jgi:hypothetical protein
MTREDYYKTIAELQEAAGITTTKSSHQRHLLKRYEILACAQVSKLIPKRKTETDQPKHVFVEEMFHILQRVHIVTDHGGRDKMTKEASKKYANITEASIELFKSLCTQCLVSETACLSDRLVTSIQMISRAKASPQFLSR